MKFQSIFWSLAQVLWVYSQSNNVCRSYSGYLNMAWSKDCFYTPDLYQPYLVERHVGTCQTFNVTTEDGYILKIFRIPRNNPKGVIILQHPLTTDARIWVSQDNDSTAFTFWRAGYDVWMPNNRGTYYSKKHTNLTVLDPKFWDFSFHEMGVYDHKVVVEFIKNKTGSEVFFIGHSMATTSGLIYSSMLPEEARSSVKLMVHMAPIAHMQYMRSPARVLTPFIPLIKKILNLLKYYSLGQYDIWYTNLVRSILIFNPFKYLDAIGASLASGWTPNEADPTLFNYLYSVIPSELSLKIYEHYGQIINSRDGTFKMFDYGISENRKLYHSDVAPFYPLDKIKVPTFLVYTKEDTFSAYQDVERLYQSLEGSARAGKLIAQHMNHVDYHIGKHRHERVYDEILKLLSKF